MRLSIVNVDATPVCHDAPAARPAGPVRSPAAWLAADLARDSDWIVHFSDAERVALEATVASARERGLEAFRCDRSDLPLDALQGLLARCRAALDTGRGVLLLRGLTLDRFDEAGLYLLYWALAVHLGEPIVQNARGELLGEVRDRGYDYGANNVRGYNTRAELKPHCDPADCVGLLCVQPARAGGESYVASAVSIYNAILAAQPELIEPLHQGFHFDLRGEGVTGAPNEVTFHRVPVFSYHAGQLSCRFNARTIVDGMRKAGVAMTELEQRAVARVGELAAEPRFAHPMQFQRGDIQWLCNHSVLHARGGFEDDPDPRLRRRLLRVWVNFPDGRPLEPRFADRFNTGARRGIQVQPGADYWVRG